MESLSKQRFSRNWKAVFTYCGCNSTEEVWSLLSGLKASNHTTSIHYVLDNSGFELLADLVFISYLLDSGFTKRVIMHGECTSYSFEVLVGGPLPLGMAVATTGSGWRPNSREKHS